MNSAPLGISLLKMWKEFAGLLIKFVSFLLWAAGFKPSSGIAVSLNEKLDVAELQRDENQFFDLLHLISQIVPGSFGTALLPSINSPGTATQGTI
jgi:hypothetical protein